MQKRPSAGGASLVPRRASLAIRFVAGRRFEDQEVA
jgi:hypothetical protein